MASDELVWKILDNRFCSYKMSDHLSTKEMKPRLCKHPMNVDGRCMKPFCPLANSKYATLIEKKGKVFLCIKTPERVHTPAKWWEYIPLPSNNRAKAFEIITSNLQWWDKRTLYRVKKRYIYTMLMIRRIRKLRTMALPKLETYSKKKERQLDSREERAFNIAKIESKVEQELLDRLRNGVYGDLYKNREQEAEAEEELEKELAVSKEMEFEEDDDDEDLDVDELRDLLSDEEEEMGDDDESEKTEDIEDILAEFGKRFDTKKAVPAKPSLKKKPTKKGRKEIEYEEEHVPLQKQLH